MRRDSPAAPTARRHLPSAMRYLGACAHDEPLDVTLVLRRRQPLERPMPRVRRTEFAARYGADPADVERVRAFGRQHGMQERACDMGRRTLHWRGSAQALQRAFGVKLGRYEISPGGATFIGCSGTPTLPGPEVIAVLGLDRRPVAHPHFRVAQAQPAMTFTPVQIGQLYAFPDGDGSGQTIAIIELGGGYQQSDLDTYFSGLGLQTPSVSAVPVDGGSNQPGSSADAEVLLDIEVAGALAPAATYVVYFAPNTDQGFYDAISQAAHSSDRPATVMSISWGGPEDSWSAASRDAMETALEDAAMLGVTVCVAAGDGGSSDGESDGQPHADYPAASPSVLACGGTKLMSGGDAITGEVVWNETAAGEGATGGGVSAVFALPTWQADVNVPTAPNGVAGRGVPDVAGNADPLTGYEVLVDGQDEVVGGTSAVAPLWAALVARLDQQLGKSLGHANATLYGIDGNGFRDITQGNNGAYMAGAGWDACTGWGSPDGAALLGALSGAGSEPTPACPPEGGEHKHKRGPGKPKPRGSRGNGRGKRR